MTIRITALVILIGSAAALGCATPSQRQSNPSSENQGQSKALTKAESSSQDAGATGQQQVQRQLAHTQCAKQNNDGCSGADGPGKPGADQVREQTDPQTGQPMWAAGEKLTAAPLVTVKQLHDNADSYVGKRVRLEGSVNAMCHHRRLWFSVQDTADRTGSFLKVTTWPSFLVPEQAMGKRVRVEGLLRIVEQGADHSRHLAREHKIGQESTNNTPIKVLSLNATGAEFY